MHFSDGTGAKTSNFTSQGVLGVITSSKKCISWSILGQNKLIHIILYFLLKHIKKPSNITSFAMNYEQKQNYFLIPFKLIQSKPISVITLRQTKSYNINLP